VPPEARANIPFKSTVEPDAVVVKPVDPPLKVRTPAAGEAVVASSAFTVMIAPEAETALKLGSDPMPFEVNTKLAVEGETLVMALEAPPTRTSCCVMTLPVTEPVPWPVSTPVRVVAPVPPLATFNVPVRSIVAPEAIVVNPVVPPDIVTVVPVIEPESPSMVIIPEPENDWKEGLNPAPLLVSICPDIPRGILVRAPAALPT
jgi:hypothetical protein